MAEDDAGDHAALIGVDRFQLLVDAVEEYAIFILDRTGRVATWNSGAERIKGYSAAEIVGEHFSTFYPESDVRDGKPARELAVATELGRYREEGWRVRKDGSMFWANVVITAIRDPNGRVAGFAKITRDETDRRAAETAASNAVADAVEANASKDRFLARMSHELRTPLNAILGFGQLMQLEGLPTTHRDSINHIIGAGNHLLALIDDVLDISRMESGEVRLSLEPVRLAEVVDEAVRMLQPLSARHRVPILVGDIGRELYVRADRQRLAQVVLNLLSNAIKYNNDNGTARVEARPEADGGVRLSVIDDGPGIAAQDAGRLFQPFERLAAAQAGIDGTGLGLALSKTLMTAMNGQIGVDSELGNGSTFWIALPSTGVERVALPPTLIARPRHDPHPTTRKTVLCIEDNLSNVRLIERIFARRPSVTLLVATLGSAGIAAALEHRPDLILLDLHLPDMTGDDVLRRLRSELATATTPIVIVSADATAGSPRRLRALGATDFMTKPFDIQLLLDIVDGAAGSGSPAETPSDRGPHIDPYITDFVHDLNNSVGVIVNYSTILSHTVTDPEASADVKQIQIAAEKVVQQSRALLEHAREQARHASD